MVNALPFIHQPDSAARKAIEVSAADMIDDIRISRKNYRNFTRVSSGMEILVNTAVKINMSLTLIIPRASQTISYPLCVNSFRSRENGIIVFSCSDLSTKLDLPFMLFCDSSMNALCNLAYFEKRKKGMAFHYNHKHTLSTYSMHKI